MDWDYLLQSPWLWAAAALSLLMIGFWIGSVAGARRARRDIDEAALRREEASYHLAMGLSSVIAGDSDLAIRELRRVAETDTEAIEIYILLGDLLRERGRVEQGIRIHKAVLKRPDLSDERRTVALASLAKDFARAGFVDRATRTFREVAERDPDSLTPWHHLERLHEEMEQWQEALSIQQRILQLRGDREDRKVLGFLHWKVGEELAEAGQGRKALRSWGRAVQTWKRTTPAWLAQGDHYRDHGDARRAEEAWLAAADADPDRTWLALQRLDPLWRASARADKVREFVEERMRAHPHDWHLPLHLARAARERGDIQEAFQRLRQALERNPRSAGAQGLAWQFAISEKGSAEPLRELVRVLDDADAFNEAQLCLRCRYRATELLWRCPHCHNWDTFVSA